MLLGGAKRLKSYSNPLNSPTLHHQNHHLSDFLKADSIILEFAGGSSSLCETLRPFEIVSIELSLASRSKCSKEAKASTAKTRILGEVQGDFAKDSSDFVESIKVSDKIDCHDSTMQNLAMTKRALAESTKDFNILDYHEFNRLHSRNDEIITDSSNANYKRFHKRTA